MGASKRNFKVEGRFLKEKYILNIPFLQSKPKALRNLNLHHESLYDCSHFLALLKRGELFCTLSFILLSTVMYWSLYQCSTSQKATMNLSAPSRTSHSTHRNQKTPRTYFHFIAVNLTKLSSLKTVWSKDFPVFGGHQNSMSSRTLHGCE